MVEKQPVFNVFKVKSMEPLSLVNFPTNYTCESVWIVGNRKCNG